MDIRAMARSLYDPGRFNSGYRAEKRRLREAITDQTAAQDAKFGSIAQREDPNRFGSLASRFSNAFGPEDPGLLHDPAYDVAEEQAAEQEAQLTNKRRKLRRDTSLDDTDPLELLNSFGLGTGLRRGL